MPFSPWVVGSVSQFVVENRYLPEISGVSLHFYFSIQNSAVPRLKPWGIHPLSSPRRCPPVLGTGQVPCRAWPEPRAGLASNGGLNGHCYLAELVVNKNEARPDVETC